MTSENSQHQPENPGTQPNPNSHLSRKKGSSRLIWAGFAMLISGAVIGGVTGSQSWWVLVAYLVVLALLLLGPALRILLRVSSVRRRMQDLLDELDGRDG